MKEKLNLFVLFLIVYIGLPVLVWSAIELMPKLPVLAGAILSIIGFIWAVFSYGIAKGIAETIGKHV